MATNTEQQTLIHVSNQNKAELTTFNMTYKMDAEGTDVGSSFAGNPEDTEVAIL